MTKNSYIEILKKRREEILKEKEELDKEDPFHNPDHAADNASDTDAYEQREHEKVEVLESALDRELSNIEKALKKIEQGSYGTCESCGEPISEERLGIVPEASLCINCQKNS